MKEIKRLQIGKNGLSEGFIEQVKGMFENEEVIKIHILKSACRGKEEARKMALDLANSLGKNYGFTIVGYVITMRKFRRDQR